jgi:hypothetical protein
MSKRYHDYQAAQNAPVPRHKFDTQIFSVPKSQTVCLLLSPSQKNPLSLFAFSGGVIVAVAGTTVAGTIVAGMAVAEMTVAGTGMAVADHLVAPAAAALVESKADAPALVAPRENAAAAPQGGNAAAAHKREGAAARKERAAAAVH